MYLSREMGHPIGNMQYFAPKNNLAKQEIFYRRPYGTPTLLLKLSKFKIKVKFTSLIYEQLISAKQQVHNLKTVGRALNQN